MGCNNLEYFCSCLFMIFISYKHFLEALLSFVIFIGNSYFPNVNRNRHGNAQERMRISILDSSFAESRAFLQIKYCN